VGSEKHFHRFSEPQTPRIEASCDGQVIRRKEAQMMNTELDALLRTWIPSEAPGVAVALRKEDQIVHCQGYGLANMEWGQPVTPQTVFALGSITKPFTATAIMLLERQGKLRLDDTIQTYLPEYPIYEHRVTLRHLLTHTSGIANFVTQPEFWERHAQVERSIDDVIAIFKDLPFDFEPGTHHSYSNSGYVLLGRILEKLLDTSYAEAIQQLIFDPLGMTHSHYLRPEPVIPLRASGYTCAEQEYRHARIITPAVKYAAGGLGSTLEDMLLWDTALREERLIDHATQERMYTPVQLSGGRTENYGLGWAFGHYHQHRVIHHAGGIPGFSAFFGRFPNDGVTIIILSNREGFDAARLARKMSHLVLDFPLVTRPSVALNPEILGKVVGAYTSVYGTTEVRKEEHTLYLCRKTRHALLPTSETSFYQADDEDIEVFFENQNEQGFYTRIRVIQPFFWFTAERVTVA
jgi:CubicO group peptidase (beta-lactamase class C family)